MAILSNQEIRDTFNYLSTIENVLIKEINSVNGNKSHLDKIVPEGIVKIYSSKYNIAQTFTKNLYTTYYEASVIALVASFEKIIFAKYKTAYGAIKNVVEGHTEKTIDYYKSRHKFVNGDIDKLHSMIDLIEGQIDINLLSNLKRIKEQRDYLAHGKRFGEAPAIEMPLADIAELLDKVISEIEH